MTEYTRIREMEQARDLEQARELLTRSERIVVLTGAGVSAESGVPTFRGADGLWRRHRPEELATPQAFSRDPRLVWEWYGWRRSLIAGCRPNAAHLSLARLALSRRGVRIVTQNVDALHGDAALAVAMGRDTGGAMPLELHGSIFRVRCTACARRQEHRGPIDATSVDTLPLCGACGAPARPDVVWFGEMLDPRVIEEAMRLGREADACLVVGTSAVIYPAVGVAMATAESGGALIEVNPDPTPLTPIAAISLRATAAEMVPQLFRDS